MGHANINERRLSPRKIHGGGFLRLYLDWARVSQTFSSTVIPRQQTTDNGDTPGFKRETPFYLLAVNSAPSGHKRERERRNKNNSILLLPVLMISTRQPAFLLNVPAEALDHRKDFQRKRRCKNVASHLHPHKKTKTWSGGRGSQTTTYLLQETA